MRGNNKEETEAEGSPAIHFCAKGEGCDLRRLSDGVCMGLNGERTLAGSSQLLESEV